MIQTNEIQLWHKILGHINFEFFVKTNKIQLVKGLPNISKPIKSLCKSCHHGNQTRVSFRTKEQSSSRPLEMIHMYLCGPAMVQTLQGERYFILLIDDFTRMIWVTFLKKTLNILISLKDSRNWLKMKLVSKSSVYDQTMEENS